jgi:CO/xanthine dehydrogenase FAD-binding subunit
MVNSFFPKTLAEALKSKSQNPALLPYAGGTDFMVNRREGAQLLFLNAIPELAEIADAPDSLTLGACCTYTGLLESKKLPGILHRAIALIASPAIRNLGTVGGNICNASPAGDTLPPLYALSARVRLQSVRGSREVLLASFIQGVRKINLAPDELLTQIIIPKSDFSESYYKKVGARSAVAISKASFAGFKKIENGVVTAIPMAFGSVAATVVRNPEIESTLVGKTQAEISAESGAVARMYDPLITPIDDQRSTAEYRKKVCLALLIDFLSHDA